MKQLTTQGAPRYPRRDSGGKRSLLLPLEARPDSPGEHGMSVGFPRKEYWSRLPFPSPRDLPDAEVELASSELAGRFFTTESPEKSP